MTHHDIEISIISFDRNFVAVRVNTDRSFICFFHDLYLLVQRNIFPVCFSAYMASSISNFCWEKNYVNSWWNNLSKVFSFQSWNYNTSRNSMLENPFIKFYWIRQTFEDERDLLWKKRKYFLLPDDQLNENLILVFGFYEREKKG